MSGGDSDWQAILRSDEKILWQGAPYAGLRWAYSSPQEVQNAFGFAIIAVVCLTHYGDTKAWHIAFFVVLLPAGLIALALAYHFIIGIHFRDARIRRHTTYFLTNRRAMIVMSMKTQKVDSYPIGVTTPVSHTIGPKGCVYFASVEVPQYVVLRQGGRVLWSSPNTREVGFELIPDAPYVYELMCATFKGGTQQ